MFLNVVVSGYKLGGTELVVGTIEVPANATLAQASAAANANPNVASALRRVVFISVGLTTINGRATLRYSTGNPT